MTKLRKHQPIWEQIKKTGTAMVSAEPCIHRRIVKAVQKEKLNDSEWHFIQSELYKKYKLLDTSEGKLLTFILQDVSPININSL